HPTPPRPPWLQRVRPATTPGSRAACRRTATERPSSYPNSASPSKAIRCSSAERGGRRTEDRGQRTDFPIRFSTQSSQRTQRIHPWNDSVYSVSSVLNSPLLE